MNRLTASCPVLDPGRKNISGKLNDICLLLAALFTAAAASFIFLYGDMVDMVCNSNLLLRSICEGHFLDFYQTTLEEAWCTYPANYDFPIYLIFALWNLPFSLYYHFEVSKISFLWFKVLIVLCIFICSKLMFKIYCLFDEEQNFSSGSFLLLMLSSPLVFLAEFIAAQYDCVSMILILGALYEYLKGRDTRSLILFCLAVPIKTFAIFLMIPLLAYKEKNIIKLILKIGCAMIIPICCKMLFRNDYVYGFLIGSQNRDATGLLTSARINIGGLHIHVFILLFLLICFFCYFRQYDKSKVLLLSAAIYTSFIIFVPIRSYWVFLAEPFLILLIAVKPEQFNVNFLVHSVAQVAGSMFFLYNHWIYNSKVNTRELILHRYKELPNIVEYGSVSNFINVHGWDLYMPLLRTIFIGSCLTLILINMFDIKKFKLSSQFSARVLSWLKLGLMAGMIMLMIFVEFHPCRPPVVDTLNYTGTTCRPYIDYELLEMWEDEEPMHYVAYQDDDLNGETVVEQPFKIKKARNVSRISLQFINPSTARDDRGRLIISIVEKESGAVMAETVVGTSMLKDKDINIININKTHLEKGTYLLRISNIPSEYSQPLFVMYNDREGVETISKPCRINGAKMKYPICMCLN